MSNDPTQHVMTYVSRVRELRETNPHVVASLAADAELQRDNLAKAQREFRELVADVHAACQAWRECRMQPPSGALSAIEYRCAVLLEKVPA